MDREIVGVCRHKAYEKTNDPCFGCGVCTIDGMDYSHPNKCKPDLP